MVKIKLNKIIFDPQIYPRVHISNKTITEYMTALKGGTAFPPIEIQNVKYDGAGIKTVCLDGKHRVSAIEELNKEIEQQKAAGIENNYQEIDEVEANWWKDGILDKGEHWEELFLRSMELNYAQGDRLSSRDFGYDVLQIINRRPIDRLFRVEKDIAEKFHKHKGYISRLETGEGTVSQVLAKKRISRDIMMYRLSLLGWTQEEIGEVYGFKSRSAVSENVGKLQNQLSDIRNEYIKDIKKVEEIASFNNMDVATTWAIILESKTDEERFKLFGHSALSNEAPIFYDVWGFRERDTRLGKPYDGNIPGQIVMNVLYYYTKQGDLVVDPMAGGGVTVDTCLVMSRKCRAYDICIDGKEEKKEIVKHDIKNGYPEQSKKCDLIFLDPPYYKKKEAEYGVTSVSALPRDKYLVFFEKLAQDSYDILKKDGYLAFIMSNYIDYAVPKNTIFAADYMDYFVDAGFMKIIEIQCPLSTEQYTAIQADQAKKLGKILIRSRSLFIFKKE